MRRDGKTPILGQSRAMETLRAMLRAIASSASTALISGESGTGKELIAQALHDQSPRANGPFVPLNCGAIPRELIESELFGHRKGAFTGAVTNRVGRIELANGGTLFLDEIGDLPLDMQVKLLRVLQERRILPVGAPSEEAVDVRIVAATHKDLEEEVRAGRFREDLYYRINVMSLELPPLRKRDGDIVLLTRVFLGRDWTISEDALRAIEAYHWPGNVRQLKNAVDRAQILANNNHITIDDLPLEVADHAEPLLTHATPVQTPAGSATTAFSAPTPVPRTTGVFTGEASALSAAVSVSPRLEDLEKAHIVDILRQQNGNKARAARVLGIHRRKLYRLLERHGIHDERPAV